MLDSIHDGIHGFLKSLDAEDYVSSGLYALDCSILGSVLPADGSHLHGIGYDDVFVAQLLSQLVLENGLGESGGNMAAVHLRAVTWVVMMTSTPWFMPALKGFISQRSISSHVLCVSA